jgi:hypothetical protein
VEASRLDVVVRISAVYVHTTYFLTLLVCYTQAYATSLFSEYRRAVPGPHQLHATLLISTLAVRDYCGSSSSSSSSSSSNSSSSSSSSRSSSSSDSRLLVHMSAVLVMCVFTLLNLVL